MNKQIKTRDQIDSQWKWHLEDIFPSNEEWENEFALTKSFIEDYKKYQDTKEISLLKNAIIDYFKIYSKIENLFAYARMNLDGDNSNSFFQGLVDRISSLIVVFQTVSSFLIPTLLSLSEDTLNALAADEQMSDYNVFISDLLREKPHVLPAREERLMAMAGELTQSPDNIYSMLTHVDIAFPPLKNEEGVESPLTEANYNSYIQSSNRQVRENAFTNLFSTYKSFGTTIATTYSSNVKGDLFHSKARNFPSALEATLFPNQIPLSVYDNLVQIVHSSISSLDQYMSLRSKVLQLPQLHMYDLYTSIVEDFDMELPYPEAYQLVLEGLAPMGEEYIQVLKRAQEEGWIDVYPNVAKTNGAYSFGVHTVHPFVLLNHQNDLNSTMTIAHELGHAMHSYYSSLTQPAPKADYSLFVAEVASTCNEVLLIRHLMKKHEENPKALAYLYNYFLEQFRTTVFRQTMFAEFEQIAHQMAENSEPLTQDSLNEMYYTLNQRYYGKHCHVDELIAYEWMRIPHFYRSFYVYQYATGFSAAVTLADRILELGEPALQGYKNFLKSGSSIPPIEALKLAGIDMSSPEPIQHAMSVFRSSIEKLSQLLLP